MNITPDAWQADTETLRARAEQAEARIQAVRDALDQYDQHMGLPPLISADVIRRALDGDA